MCWRSMALPPASPVGQKVSLGRPEAMYTFPHTRKRAGVLWGWDGMGKCMSW